MDPAELRPHDRRLTGYYSTDASTTDPTTLGPNSADWTPINSTTAWNNGVAPALPSTFELGLDTCSHDGGNMATATYTDFNYTGTNTPVMSLSSLFNAPATTVAVTKDTTLALGGAATAGNFAALTINNSVLTLSAPNAGTPFSFATGITCTTTSSIVNDAGGNAQVALPVNNSSVDVSGQQTTLTIGVPIADNGAVQSWLAVDGGGKVILTAANTYTGPTMIGSGTLQLGNGGSVGSIPDGDISILGTSGVLAVNRLDPVTITGQISGDGGVLQMGPGSLALNPSAGGGNTYKGGTMVTGGTLGFNAGGLGSGPVVVDPVAGGNTSATLAWGSGVTTDLTGQNGGVNGLTLNSGTTVFALGGNTAIFDGTIFGGGALEIGGGTLQIGFSDANGSLGSLSGVNIHNDGVLAFDRNDNPVVSTAISGPGGVLQQVSTLTLTGPNTYQGGTTVSQNAAVQVGSTGALGSGPVVLNGYGATLVLDGAGSFKVGNTITDAGGGQGVVQVSGGSVALTGNNSYTGGTSVIGGQLAAESISAIPSGSLLSIGGNGSVVLGTPGAVEPLGSLAGGAGPLTSQSSAGGSQVAAPALGGGVNPVPEPGTLALLAAGAACGLAAAWRKRRRA